MSGRGSSSQKPVTQRHLRTTRNWIIGLTVLNTALLITVVAITSVELAGGTAVVGAISTTLQSAETGLETTIQQELFAVVQSPEFAAALTPIVSNAVAALLARKRNPGSEAKGTFRGADEQGGPQERLPSSDQELPCTQDQLDRLQYGLDILDQTLERSEVFNQRIRKDVMDTVQSDHFVSFLRDTITSTVHDYFRGIHPTSVASNGTHKRDVPAPSARLVAQ